MDNIRESVARSISMALSVYEDADNYEGRDALFDMLVAAYEGELCEALCRAGKPITPVQQEDTREKTADAVLEKLSGRLPAGYVAGKYSRTVHGGPAVLVDWTGGPYNKSVAGVHVYPEGIQVVQLRGDAVRFRTDEVEEAIQLVVEIVGKQEASHVGG